MTTPPCWCCALWAITTPGTRHDPAIGPGLLCDPCAGTTPGECNARHQKDTATPLTLAFIFATTFTAIAAAGAWAETRRPSRPARRDIRHLIDGTENLCRHHAMRDQWLRDHHQGDANG